MDDNPKKENKIGHYTHAYLTKCHKILTRANKVCAHLIKNLFAEFNHIESDSSSFEKREFPRLCFIIEGRWTLKRLKDEERKKFCAILPPTKLQSFLHSLPSRKLRDNSQTKNKIIVTFTHCAKNACNKKNERWCKIEIKTTVTFIFFVPPAAHRKFYIFQKSKVKLLQVSVSQSVTWMGCSKNSLTHFTVRRNSFVYVQWVPN